jgi:nucleoside-diphosphate-sugar epimerase
MRALVTGATGFIGNYLVLELRRRGWDVVCMTRRPVETKDANIRCVQADLLQPAQLDGVLRSAVPVDSVFHFAALLPEVGTTIEQYLLANCVATSRLLELAGEMGAKSFVYASSLPVIGTPEHLPITEEHSLRPKHPYHLSKLCGEMACEMARRMEKRNVSSLRITSPYGPGMVQNSVLPRFVSKALQSEEIHWMGSGSRAQNFVHVTDVVAAALLAAETDKPGLYNMGGSETTSMEELARLVTKLTPGTRSKVSASGQPDPEERCRWEVDLTRAAAGLGYRPKVPLEQGLGEYIEWMQSGQEMARWWNT